MKPRLWIAAALICAPLAGCGPVIMRQRLSKKNVCPSADTRKCVQSTGNMTPIYVEKRGRFIPIDGQNPPDYWAYLGRMWTGSATPVSNFCGNTIANPFKAYETATAAAQAPVTALGAPVIDSKFFFSRKATDQKAIESALDVAQVLNRAGVPLGVPGRPQAEAQLKLMASKTAKSAITMEGNYHFVYLNPSVVAALFAADTPAALKSCASYLRDNNAAIVTGLTGVLVRSLGVENTSQTKIESDLKVALTGLVEDPKIAQIGIEWKREVEEVFRSETKPVFQVLSVSHQRLPSAAAQ